MKPEKTATRPDEVLNPEINLSRHSRVRAQQRGLTENLIFLAMDYSKAIFKQGLVFYAVIDKLLPDNLDHQLREKLNNLVIVASQENDEIITCYKRDHAIHYINKKPKRLAA